MVNIGMGMIVKSLKLGNICAEPQYFRQGAWQAEGEGAWSRSLPKSVKVTNFMLREIVDQIKPLFAVMIMITIMILIMIMM